jgi:hypothetical protein
VRLQLLGGTYVTRWVGASSSRSVNYFPEANPKDSPTGFTCYQRPGLRQLIPGPLAAPVRGIHQSSQQAAFCVIGQNVYLITQGWGLEPLGVLQTPGAGPTSFTDNGLTGLLVDGSGFGYSIDLASGAFAAVADPSGLFTGATHVDVIDGFMLWNFPNTKLFGATLDNELAFDPTYFGGKNNYPDNLLALKVNRHEILLFGRDKSEIWYNAGNPLFPFAELPGAYIEHGVLAPFSVASQDIETYWLGRDRQGQGMVFMQKGYDTKRISNHGVEFAFQQMAAAGADLSQAIGYTYQQGGHVFYVLTFPSGDQTWVYDASVGDPMLAWHQRAWTDQQGILHRVRDNCFACVRGKNLVGDWENGNIYELDPTVFVDQVLGGPQGVWSPLTCIRTLQHIRHVPSPGGMVDSDDRQITFNYLLADMQVGEGQPQDINGLPPQVSLRWSTDRGKTFGNAILQSNGRPGQFQTDMKWGPCGTAKDMVLEIFHSVNGPAALNGAWVDIIVGGK